MYLKKNVKIQDGYYNIGVYDFNTKKLYLISKSNFKRIISKPEELSPEITSKISDIFTNDRLQSEQSPLNFDYLLFDDHDTYQTSKMVYFEVTNKCNFNCLHCYADMSCNGNEFLSTEQYEEYINNLDDNTNYDIRLTGGEPFLNPFITELISITSKRITPYNRHSVVTNGTFEISKAIHALELGFELQISVYGLSLHTFKNFAHANEESYNKVMNNLKILSNSKYASQITLLLSINSLTFSEVQEFVDFAKNMGFKPMLNRPASIGRALTNWDILKLSSEQHIDFNRYNKHLVKGYNRYCYHACRLTWSYVDIYGNVKPCAFIRDTYNFGNLKDRSLKTIRSSDLFTKFRNLNASSFDKCNECEFKYACTGGCCGETLSYTGKINDTYPWCTIKPYENSSYLNISTNEVYQVEKYSGGTFDFIKL